MFPGNGATVLEHAFESHYSRPILKLSAVKGKFYFIFHLTWTNTFVKYDKNKLLEK
jgi:hypothetical protein